MPKEPIAEKKRHTVDEIKTVWDSVTEKIVLLYEENGHRMCLSEDDHMTAAAGFPYCFVPVSVMKSRIEMMDNYVMEALE